MAVSQSSPQSLSHVLNALKEAFLSNIASSSRNFSHASRSLGFSGNLAPQTSDRPHDENYVGKTDPKDPVLSPLFADLHGFPPSLLVTSTRDLLLSNTSIFHRALLDAKCEAHLVVFEALPHAFWYHFQLPETKEALQIMANFFDEKLGK